MFASANLQYSQNLKAAIDVPWHPWIGQIQATTKN
jgi:hypothetical protein